MGALLCCCMALMAAVSWAFRWVRSLMMLMVSLWDWEKLLIACCICCSSSSDLSSLALPPNPCAPAVVLARRFVLHTSVQKRFHWAKLRCPAGFATHCSYCVSNFELRCF